MDDTDKTALLAALRHVHRRAILRYVKENPESSPSEVAKAMGEPLSNIGYHARVLRECGAIELVRQAPSRGAIQNFYRLSIDEPWVLEVLEQDD